jgi:exopolysaccharide production protein ExoZ
MLNNVQVLRAIAACFVLAAHTFQGLNEPQAGGLWGFGIYGVDLFFVISGFVMVYTTSRKPVTPAAFFINRIIRIVPLYWALTFLVYAMVIVAPSLFQATSSDPVELLKSLFFVAFEKSNGQVQPTLFLGWTLNYEMLFYALFAAGLTIRSVKARVLAVCALLALLALIGGTVPADAPVARFYTSSLMLEFGYGMLIGLAHERIGSKPPALALGAALVVIGLVLLVLGPRDTGGLRFLTAGLPAAAVVWGAIALEARGWRITSPALLLLGAASYSLYLTHMFPVGAIEHVAGRLGLDHGWLVPATAVLSFAAAIAAAVAVHLVLERPVDRALRRRARSRFQPNQDDSAALWPWRRRDGRSRGDKQGERR